MDESLLLYKNYRKFESREYEEKYIPLIKKEIEEQYRQFEQFYHIIKKTRDEMERAKNKRQANEQMFKEIHAAEMKSFQELITASIKSLNESRSSVIKDECFKVAENVLTKVLLEMGKNLLDN